MDNNTNAEPTTEQAVVPGIDPATLADLKRQVGELTSGELPLTDQQIINLFYPVGAQTYTDGSVTFRSIIWPRKFCRDASLLDATGQVATDGTGTVTFLLSNFICSTVNSFQAPVNLLATPFSTRPVYVTTQYNLVPNPAAPGSFNDLEITLMAWSPGGTPAPEVVIDWRCRLVSVPIIL